jgi:hypothetical protein
MFWTLSLDVVDMNGWNLGGRIAIDVASPHPSVRRLVLTAPTLASASVDTMIDDASLPTAVMRPVITRPGASGLRILTNAFHSGNSSRLASFTARRMALFAHRLRAKPSLNWRLASSDPRDFLEGPRQDLHNQNCDPDAHPCGLGGGMTISRPLPIPFWWI